MRVLPGPVESLWTLFTAPVVWAIHFLVCYTGAAIYCAKRGELGLGFGVIQIGIATVTLVALAMIVLSAWLAWRRGEPVSLRMLLKHPRCITDARNAPAATFTDWVE